MDSACPGYAPVHKSQLQVICCALAGRFVFVHPHFFRSLSYYSIAFLSLPPSLFHFLARRRIYPAARMAKKYPTTTCVSERHSICRRCCLSKQEERREWCDPGVDQYG